MGGQACILYGAAEFSRDVDFAVLADEKNLQSLRKALADLQAEPVFVPPLGEIVLRRGHACHFRAQVAEAKGIRIDIMAVMHGCDSFEKLWRRRRRIRLPKVGPINVLALIDLVQAKKTQRDKDWPMVRRLIEVDYHRRPRKPPRNQVLFWLKEARTPALLIELGRKYPGTARRVARSRPAVARALKGDVLRMERALRAEEESLRNADRSYWQPLRAELFAWRRGQLTNKEF
jgi:hypothetical protein